MIPPPAARVVAPAPATPSVRVVAASVGDEVPENEGRPSVAVSESRTASSGESGEDGGVTWPDDAAESSYLAEARERGETPVPAAPKAEEKEDADPKTLPSLEELVERIPPGVREVLDDLFRAKFTKVRRIPRSALKR